MTRPRVLTALSGGVDSSVAALLLQQQGYEVIGVFLRNGIEAPSGRSTNKQGCCSIDDALDAARVADRLGIPFHAIDMKEEFGGIIDSFVEDYLQGRTPNPCIRCNRDIKFGALWNMADALGADFLASGHYAQVIQGDHGAELHRGLDPRKDQSYVLFPVGPERLSRTLLPVGGLQKSETRRLAEEAGLPVFAKPDSVEICFVPSGDYRDLLRERGGLGRPGNLVHQDGRVLAAHEGHAGFTRGQRRGLGIASTEPLYVLDIDEQSGDVLVGPRQATGCAAVTVDAFQTFACQLQAGQTWKDVQVQYRSTPGGHPAELHCLESGKIAIRFHHPVESVNPGQGLAVYRGAQLLGGGWIAKVERVSELSV